MPLAKIKGNKDYFGKLVTFLEKGGVCLCPTDPLEVVLGGHLLENFLRGGSAQILSLRGVRPPRTPLRTSMLMGVHNLCTPMGSFNNHVDKILIMFNPLPPPWTILPNKTNEVTRTFDYSPLLFHMVTERPPYTS